MKTLNQRICLVASSRSAEEFFLQRRVYILGGHMAKYQRNLWIRRQYYGR